MTTVRVNIGNRDRRVGAMVKALAIEVAGFQAVKGTTKEFLQNHGYSEFEFPDDYQAQGFRETVSKYIKSDLATVSE
jgi:hypothetical protein